MSTNATGRVVDENGQGVGGLSITLVELGSFDYPLASGTTQSDGTYSVGPYLDDINKGLYSSLPRGIRVSVITQNVRAIQSRVVDDTDGALSIADFKIQRADVSGFTVTLGAPAKYVSDGNGVRVLIDNQEAWKHLADALKNASTSIDIMQLEFDVPPAFNSDPSKEEPQIVLAFSSPIDPKNPPKTNQPPDFRAERILLDRASHGVKTRLLISGLLNFDAGTINATGWILLFIVFLIALALLPISAPLAYVVAKMILNRKGSAKFVKRYFSGAGSTANVEEFQVRLFNVVHAKLALVDETEAIVTASPLIQSYYDTPAHKIDEPMRGGGGDIPKHDVSMAVRGPAVADMYENFALHWNYVKPNDVPATIARAAPLTAGADADEKIASLQLMRTLNEGVFPAPLDKGEMGILEGYLRAIGSAKKYIYLENQYFTSDTIGKAIIAAIKAQPTLQVIVVINLKPDVPTYPGMQNDLIEQIRKESDPTRVGFFSPWTHEAAAPPDHANPRIIPNYFHTKAAIVDDVWATIGSGNLDGASLEYTQLLHWLQSGNLRNHEMNYAIFNGIEGHPTTDFVDLVRRRLWGEHLGIDPGDAQLALGGPNDGKWLTLWQTTAERKRAGLQNNPATPDVARVLEYKDPTSKPKTFLKNLSIGFDHLDLVDKVRSFSFFKGDWE